MTPADTTAPPVPDNINNDAIVNQLDLNVFVGNWQKTSTSDPAAVPEPTSLAACGLALLPLIRRRRRA